MSRDLRQFFWKWITFVWVLSCLGLGMVACTSSSTLISSSDYSIKLFSPSYSNVYLLEHSGKHLLVDSGFSKDSQKLEAFFKDNQVTQASLKGIVLTHGHADHAGGAHGIQKKWGTPILAGKEDEVLFSQGRNDKLCPVGWVARRLESSAQAETYDPYRPTIWVNVELNLEDTLGFPAQVIPIPGHTPGSLFVVFEQGLFVGDLVRGAMVGGGPEIHFFQCDLWGNKENMSKLMKRFEKSNHTVFPGHMSHFGLVEISGLLN